ncbi:MAG: hypothetical protein H6Q74_1176 [Firmicutes bacterium]|nr:hypothetical protein [Bacillota bacterium]
MLILPVSNGILPNPNSGKMVGAFAAVNEDKVVAKAGQDVLVCPLIMDNGSLYPVGVVARILNIWMQQAYDSAGHEVATVLAVLEGHGCARWHTLRVAGNNIFSTDLEAINLKAMRKEYPTISGAGWIPAGGFTEFRDKTDIPVTIYGANLEDGRGVSIRGNLGGLVSAEQAHTIEHGIIRSLHTYGICTSRTLQTEMAKETAELKQSVEWGMRFAMPEIIGRTSTGACGNPMSNLAQFYLTQELIDSVANGKSVRESLDNARRSTMSQLTSDLGLTTASGIRVLEGLKKGMRHDDTQLKMELLKKIIMRFPIEP